MKQYKSFAIYKTVLSANLIFVHGGLIKLLCKMKYALRRVTATSSVHVVLLVLIIVLNDSATTARSLLPNRRRVAERELTREANSDLSADEVTSTNPQVDDFIAELANLSIPHYLKDLYLNFTYSDGKIGGGMKANTIRSYENTAKSELYIITNFI